MPPTTTLIGPCMGHTASYLYFFIFLFNNSKSIELSDFFNASENIWSSSPNKGNNNLFLTYERSI